MPVKFDDISKTANDLLSEDYQTKGYAFKAKQKTGLDGAVVTTSVDWVADAVKTPAKLSWKFPAPMGYSQLSIDKLEMDKAGKFKLECSSDKLYKGLKVEKKTDLVSMHKTKLGFTYTGLNDVQIKVEATAMDPTDFVAEATYSLGDATCGTKLTMATLTSPDIGVRWANGPYSASLYAKNGFSAFSAHGFYKATPELKCAATYEHGGTNSGNFSLGLAYAVAKGTSVKAKVQQDQSVSCTVKHDVAKGFTVMAGGRYEVASGKTGCGLSLSIE